MVAEVIVDISNGNVDRVFDYLANEDIRAGMRVQVPFGRKVTEGYVIALKDKTAYEYELKQIIKPLDEFEVIIPEMLDLMWHMRDRYNLRLIDIMRLFVPSGMRSGRANELKRLYVELEPEWSVEEIISKLRINAVKQIAIIEKLSGGGEFLNLLQEEYGAASIKSLRDKGYLRVSAQKISRIPYRYIETINKNIILNCEQQAARDAILQGAGNKFLLHGVTGSGKTEIYMSIIADALKSGKNAIMLVPEISLTPQLLKYLRGRFGEAVAILHSGLSEGERRDEWTRLREGSASVVVGARSAIFAPISNVGVIVMDEEHEQSYISESNPRYDTRKIAEWRADYNKARLIMGSATPSIETYYSAKADRYQLVELIKRVNDIKMPAITVVDMREELRRGRRGIFSRPLEEALRECIEQDNQAMIYINRRGFSSFVMCRSCGKVLKCEACDVSLTYHREDNLLKCHYCGARYTMITNCPECGASEIRLGRVGTEQAVAELNKLFSGVRVLRMDNDTTRAKNAYYDILDQFAERKASILVGTQMIAKGHDFPKVTVVGILDADMSLYFSEYASAERTFQLVTQVAGRAGRGDTLGRVFLQTYSPMHYIFSYAVRCDYKGFYDKEVNVREVTKFPPFTTIVRILVTAMEEADALSLTKANYIPIKALSEEFKLDFIYLQAMHAPIKRIESKFRYQILMRLLPEREEEIISKIYRITDANRSNKATLFIEINPQNLN